MYADVRTFQYDVAGIIRKNNSLLCMGRPNLGMLRADDWRQIAGYKWEKPGGVGIRGEDPMVWEDSAGILHVVTHGGGTALPCPASIGFFSSFNVSRVSESAAPPHHCTSGTLTGSGPVRVLYSR